MTCRGVSRGLCGVAYNKPLTINQDGKVTADDAIIIARYAAGYGNYKELYTKYI